MKNKRLLVFALREENPDIFDHDEVLYTGLGKVQAAISLSEYLAERRPSCVVNLGTAGSSEHPAGSVVCCNRFIQRDMNCTALGYQQWQVPFSEIPIVLEYGEAVTGLPLATCGTGDSFDTTHSQSQYTIVDMEAYALALVCQRKGVPFVCLKYISDGANSDAATDWNDSLLKAGRALQQALHLRTAAGNK